MSTAEHQRRWRVKQRGQGGRPVTLWLYPSTLDQLSRVCQKTAAPRAFTLRRALEFAFMTAHDPYWHTVRQEWEALASRRGKG